jgi:hypothetical protein
LASREQEALLEVQELDTEIDRHRHRRAHLEERAAIRTIDERGSALATQLAAARGERDGVASRQAVLETDLSATEERAQAVSRRLYGGEVSASRELQAMAAEIESLKRRASELEDRILAVLDEREPLDSQVERIEGEMTALAKERSLQTQRLAAAEGGIDAETGVLERRRAEAASALPEGLLQLYERVRAKLGGVGAARLVGSQCTGCHLTLPAMEVDRIRHLPPDALVTCEECGRILVR